MNSKKERFEKKELEKSGKEQPKISKPKKLWESFKKKNWNLVIKVLELSVGFTNLFLVLNVF